MKLKLSRAIRIQTGRTYLAGTELELIRILPENESNRKSYKVRFPDGTESLVFDSEIERTEAIELK
jgi:hypothetical protein